MVETRLIRQPNLDKHLAMTLNLGKKLLTQKVSSEEFTAQRGNKDFWVFDDEEDEDHGDIDNDEDDDDFSDGGLTMEWGTRRRTAAYGKKRVYQKNTSIFPCMVKGEEDAKMEIPEKTRVLRKRKCQFNSVKYQEKKKQRIKEVPEKKFKDSQHRWTLERYQLAEQNMLKILKEKGAGPGNTILRPDLRAEARKLIGDTGLLDHLLKHMAGKLAPGGKERFRRRHNPEGAMEYWLESADLMEIRKQAGVNDPYWVPPSGWKPGDCPNHDPVCDMLMREVREEVADMKREIEKLKENKESLEQKALHEEVMKRRAQIDRQLLNLYAEIEEEIERLKQPVAGEKKGEDQLLAKGSVAATTKPETISIHKENKKQSGFRICKPQGSFLWPSQIASSSQMVFRLEDLIGYPTPPSVSSSSSSNRLPSPPLVGYPTPPSVSSSSVIRPVAMKAAVTLNFSFSTIRGSTTVESICSPTVTATIKTGCNSNVNAYVPDLNEIPMSSSFT
ncbi:unnamed protein product [Amaranthus hypochondriacus]